ncbi:MAG TPA: nucleotidyltransferase family protein [Candidatus Tripitaka californicus]|uniref:nucleotidyltransferase family protein n=1 Tax=Candidatus Tripitaka californicus TaxID=3367616 RepID=UPI002C7CC459|nr:nucleotidyltransferase family protein [Planctomycetota bacterium]HLA38012.1 nucleotidyltransferase family protein [Candidatus Brocadiales bacterium]
MKTLKKIKTLLKQHKEELRKRFKVKEIGIFGSFIREEQKKASDVDLLVEFEGPVSLLWVVRVENYLTDLLGVRVDLIPKEDIRDELKEIILAETVYL